MKKIIVALVLSTALAACSLQNDANDASSTQSAVKVVQAVNVIADLGGDNSSRV
ncbi:MAG: hypothetical protein O3C52_08370 [Proteobacteria bacterium]|nr:hypothetical protein [Pseudomonadota bacterium]MDA0913984.1 hypothetical protein [Pseudomonadota bacterium]MDA1033359.1 hypothetical protein [Pseudomonadota bacterium]